MSNQDFNQQNQQNQPQIIVIQNESQVLAAIVAFFFSGVGQLVQGRMAAGLLWLFTEVIMGGLLLIMTFGFGVVFTFFTHVLCVIDAAVYKPQSGKKLGILPFIGLLINGGGVLLIIFGLVAAASGG